MSTGHMNKNRHPNDTADRLLAPLVLLGSMLTGMAVCNLGILLFTF